MRSLRFFRVACGLALAASLIDAQSAVASAAPEWMKAQVNVPLPAYDAKTDAVLLYSETILTVQSTGSIKRLQRTAYKILRPGGSQRGTVRIDYDDQSRITSLRAWSIPAIGKDYEVKDKDAVVSAMLGVENGELISDLRTKLMRIPASVPGSIVGYEVEQEHRTYLMADEWDFQDTVPVREARYSFRLPPGWTYKTTWLNHAEVSPTSTSTAQWQWAINDVKPIRLEGNMPPWRGVAARMFVALTPPNGQDSGMQSWRDIAAWYLNLARDRRATSPEIKQQVTELTASASTQLQKMQALANFVQNNIRYVAIELGIGGHQPHYATDIFKNRFGDCKDKATLLSVMLKEIGVESYYVIINTARGSIESTTPPNLAFNHMILAIALPTELEDTTLLARTTHPKAGKILFFDPTDTLTPFGRIDGSLQANYGVLVTPEGGDLVLLPKLPASSNTIDRTAQLTLDEKGTLRGDIHEMRVGDPAAIQRSMLRSVTQEIDKIKPVESVAAASFASFEILKATIGNSTATDKPFEWHYTIEAVDYAKVAGDLLLVRPRILGSKSSALLETKEPREHSIEFERPQRDKDVFEIAIPNGYVVDELPPVVNIDNGFASYQSKTEIVGKKMRYTRIFEIKDLSVPVDKAASLKQFYRAIEGDEHNVAVLKRVP